MPITARSISTGRYALQAVIVLAALWMHHVPAAAQDEWAEFRQSVTAACLDAVGERMRNVKIAVDKFGSRRFGLALLSGTYKGDPIARICVYDKSTGQTELGGKLEVIE